MLNTINRNLRKIVLIIGAAAVILSLKETKEKEEPKENGFQQEEFDDIW